MGARSCSRSRNLAPTGLPTTAHSPRRGPRAVGSSRSVASIRATAPCRRCSARSVSAPRESSCIRASSGSDWATWRFAGSPRSRTSGGSRSSCTPAAGFHRWDATRSSSRERFPRAPIILAHLAISDLAWIWREAAGQRNLFFDTAWWNTADQLALFTLIPPGQILFASDTPYGRTVAAASLVLRVALAAGLSADQISAVAGAQLETLLAGAERHDLGPAPMTPAPSPGPLLERVHALLIAAAARLTAGYPAGEYLELARLACELPGDHPDTPVAASVRALLDRHAAYLATNPPQRGPRVPGIHLIFGLSCPSGGDSSVGQLDLDAGAAEVDHRDQGVG